MYNLGGFFLMESEVMFVSQIFLTKIKNSTMKKVIMTAALAIAAFAGAKAAGPVTLNGNFNIVVNDYLTMNPNGNWGNGSTHVFNTPAEMATGYEVGVTGFVVEASRSWHVTYSATDWTRSGAAQANVDQTVPVGDIWSIKADNGTPGVWTVGGYYPASVAGYNIAASNGGLNKTFDLNGKVTPGFGHNMSGTYTTSIAVIASLD